MSRKVHVSVRNSVRLNKTRANEQAVRAQASTEPTDDQIEALAAEHYHGMLHWDEQARIASLSQEHFDELAAEINSNATRLACALARNDPRLGGMLAHCTLKRHGITLPKL